jgi:hypothetical protein
MLQETKYLLSDAAADPAKVDQKRFNLEYYKVNSKQIGIRKFMVNLYLEH